MFSNFIENRIVCEIIQKSAVQPSRPQITVWRMRIAYWLRSSTNTHSEYVLRFVFPLEHWLREHAPLLCCAYCNRLFDLLDFRYNYL